MLILFPFSEKAINLRKDRNYNRYQGKNGYNKEVKM